MKYIDNHMTRISNFKNLYEVSLLKKGKGKTLIGNAFIKDNAVMYSSSGLNQWQIQRTSICREKDVGANKGHYLYHETEEYNIHFQNTITVIIGQVMKNYNCLNYVSMTL